MTGAGAGWRSAPPFTQRRRRLPGPGQRGVGGGFEDTGYVLVDVADDRIVCIETLFNPEFVKALTELLP
jgi:hypothetical protein